MLSFFGDDITAIELPATATESASVHKKCEEHSAPPEKTRKNDQPSIFKTAVLHRDILMLTLLYATFLGRRPVARGYMDTEPERWK